MTTQQPLPMLDEIDIYDLLTARRQIAAVWSVEDVQQTRPDLDDDQAWQVLQQVERHHDCDYGITWDTLRTTADDLFPAPDDEA